MKKRKVLKKKQKKYWALASIGLFMIASLSLFYAVGSNIFPGLTIWQMYQNLANPYVRYVSITAGMRKEEVADRFAKTLGWTEQDKQRLLRIHTTATRGATDGYYFPDTYLVSVRARPEDISKEIINEFNRSVGIKSGKVQTSVINMDTAIKIASIIQREAGEKDKKIVSGIIWNRLFHDMPLEMDATLQYAKGTEAKWWPLVRPADKNIDSPYNTYKNKGLPPSAISNPGLAAIEAAINPAKTTALFYLHDDYGTIHTANTYEEHKANIARYY